MAKNVLIFGSTGMLGQALLIECLADPRVGSVLLVNRRPAGAQHTKIKEIIHPDFYDFSALEPSFEGVDACFFCLGTTAVGKNEETYHKITYELTLAAASALQKRSPHSSFLYISGAGTDSTAKGRIMWARVKGKTENLLLDMFKEAYMLRPGYIQPVKGVVSSTSWYRAVYKLVGFLYPLMRKVAPKSLMTSEELSLAMLNAGFDGSSKKILEVADILDLAHKKP